MERIRVRVSLATGTPITVTVAPGPLALARTRDARSMDAARVRTRSTIARVAVDIDAISITASLHGGTIRTGSGTRTRTGDALLSLITPDAATHRPHAFTILTVYFALLDIRRVLANAIVASALRRKRMSGDTFAKIRRGSIANHGLTHTSSITATRIVLGTRIAIRTRITPFTPYRSHGNGIEQANLGYATAVYHLALIVHGAIDIRTATAISTLCLGTNTVDTNRSQRALLIHAVLLHANPARANLSLRT